MVGDATRASRRYAVDAAVEIRLDENLVRGRTSNLSRGGLCIELDLPLALGSSLELTLTLAFEDRGSSEPLALTGRVVWSTAIGETHQVGCQFTGLAPSQIRFLDLFLSYLDGPREARHRPRRSGNGGPFE